ncbi:hypothetical protein [Hymenobacter siberiensis]|uniref:hypothetical protein n=1 Tax=Hymenobacter siberiensis TaxID=2848396 RepID=UPI001C1E277E|nr:hypothetical protein [Hymenobacter siberiensis]MBU6122606.1 hypothetical protein [Hymenobacter siberiensis]
MHKNYQLKTMKTLTPIQKKDIRAFHARALAKFGQPANLGLSVSKDGTNAVLKSRSNVTVTCNYSLFEDLLLATQDANPNEHPFLLTAFKDETLDISWADLDTTLEILAGIQTKLNNFLNGTTPTTTLCLPKL